MQRRVRFYRLLYTIMYLRVGALIYNQEEYLKSYTKFVLQIFFEEYVESDIKKMFNNLKDL